MVLKQELEEAQGSCNAVEEELVETQVGRSVGGFILMYVLLSISYSEIWSLNRGGLYNHCWDIHVYDQWSLDTGHRFYCTYLTLSAVVSL